MHREADVTTETDRAAFSKPTKTTSMQGQALSLEKAEVAVESEQLVATVGRFTMQKRTAEASPTRITHVQGVSHIHA